MQARGIGTRTRWSVRADVVLAVALLCFGVVLADDSGEETDARRSRSLKGMSVEQLLALHHSETERVRLVALEASVTDRKGRFVRGLDKRHFRIYEDQELQKIAVFSADGAEPLSVAFLLDVSGSMRERDKLPHAKHAIRTLVEGLRPEDRFALICFADEQVAWVTDFTRNRSRFLRRLEAQRGFGRTALVDALAAAPHLVQDRIPTRKAIVLITDGIDNFSRTPVADAVELARRVNVPLFTIAFLGTSESWLPKGAVDDKLDAVLAVSRVTGGRVFPVYEDDEFQQAVDRLHNELSSQYFIGYYTDDEDDGGEFKEIRLEVAKHRLRARTRSGYYARP
jgi:Ca-activated chloride channel family protein